MVTEQEHGPQTATGTAYGAGSCVPIGYRIGDRPLIAKPLEQVTGLLLATVLTRQQDTLLASSGSDPYRLQKRKLGC